MIAGNVCRAIDPELPALCGSRKRVRAERQALHKVPPPPSSAVPLPSFFNKLR
jgi:hypothetical protein